MRAAAWLLILLVAAGGPAAADEEADAAGDGCVEQRDGSDARGEERADRDAARALRFPGSLGLTGMQAMVDARIPNDFSLRGGASYTSAWSDRDVRGDFGVSRQREQHLFGFYAGGSALGLIDVSIRVPWGYTRTKTNRKGAVDRAADTVRGWGDVEVAGKVAYGLGPLTLSPFLYGRLPTGEPDVRDLGRFEYGLAGTFAVLNSYLALHGNVAGLQEEGGLSALRYRVGASFVVYSEPDLLIRVYGYQDGIEFEGHADSDLDAVGGVQALLWERITVEVSGTYRLHDSGFVDRATEFELRAADGLTGPLTVEDAEVWSVQVRAGIAF